MSFTEGRVYVNSKLHSKPYYYLCRLIKYKNCSLFSTVKSCYGLYKSGKTTTGVYTINPDDQGAFDVRCDMETTPGRAWTVFQRRVDGSVDFTETGPTTKMDLEI